MPRDVDERKKRKALRKLRQAAARAEAGLGPELSDWEKEFLEEVEERIEKFGSAFADPEKGASDDALSALQSAKLREIDKKTRGKGGGLKARRPMGWKKPARAPEPGEDEVETTDEAAVPPRPSGPPKLRVIKGGADED